MAGKDSWQQGLADQYMELVEDMFKELVKVFFEKDEEKKVGIFSDNPFVFVLFCMLMSFLDDDDDGDVQQMFQIKKG